MIRADIVKMYKEAHSWVGIIAGLALFIAFYCGALTMFEAQINSWSAAAYTLPKPPPLERTQELIDKTIAKNPEAKKSYTINFKTDAYTPARMQWNIPTIGKNGKPMRGKDKIYYASLDDNGNVVTSPQRKSFAGKLIDDLHLKIGLPFTRYVSDFFMGTISVLYFVALISGTIVLIPSLIKDLFVIRFGKNLKRMWLDAHNLMGIFSLPFHIVMAFTAVIFAFHTPIYALQNKMLYNGNIQKLWEEIENDQIPANAKPLSVLELKSRIEQQAQNFTISSLSFKNSKDGHTTIRVTGDDPRFVTRTPTGGFGEVNPYSGQLEHTDTLPGFGTKYEPVVIGLFASHFGTYGGLPIKWAYFILGLAGAGLFYTGNILWVESKRKRARAKQDPSEIKQTKSGFILAQLTIGVSVGTIAGVSLLLALSRYLANYNAPEIYYNYVFYAALVLCVAWAFIRGPAKAGYETTFFAAFATALIPITTLISFLNRGFGIIEIVALIGTFALIYMGIKARKRAQNAPIDSVWHENCNQPANSLKVAE